jgi:ATP-dependent DNA helicase RecQ
MSLSPEQHDQVIAFVDQMKKPLGKRLIAKGLRGSQAKDVKRRGLHNNPHHGELKGVPETVVIRGIEDLLDEGRLGRRGKKYPTVWLPEKRVRPKSTGKKPSKSKDPPLIAALKAFRKKEARRRRWKAYQVFNNATMVELAESRPSTLDGLADVRGMGPARLKKFGDALLGILSSPD